jgi:hypothetical protein
MKEICMYSNVKIKSVFEGKDSKNNCNKELIVRIKHDGYNWNACIKDKDGKEIIKGEGVSIDIAFEFMMTKIRNVLYTPQLKIYL